jgi:hypothetical protein
MYTENPLLCSDEAMTREGGTTTQLAAAREELETFARVNYNALIEDGQSNESLTFMCRLDIGVMLNPTTGILEYFINEVERGCLICLFGGVGGGKANRIGDETGEVLKQRLRERD